MSGGRDWDIEAIEVRLSLSSEGKRFCNLTIQRTYRGPIWRSRCVFQAEVLNLILTCRGNPELLPSQNEE